jgi:NADH:ubiquinone oxidoreductase subunit F (NADH-binding)
MTRFCRETCGECDACRAALKEVELLDDIYGTLTEADLSALFKFDEDDPRSYALNHKGQP